MLRLDSQGFCTYGTGGGKSKIVADTYNSKVVLSGNIQIYFETLKKPLSNCFSVTKNKKSFFRHLHNVRN